MLAQDTKNTTCPPSRNDGTTVSSITSLCGQGVEGLIRLEPRGRFKRSSGTVTSKASGATEATDASGGSPPSESPALEGASDASREVGVTSSCASTKDACADRGAPAEVAENSSSGNDSDCDLEAIVRPWEVDCDVLPSVGSAKHESGACKPCAFLFRGGCKNGIDCLFCHICDSDTMKVQKKKRNKLKREAIGRNKALANLSKTLYGEPTVGSKV